SQKKIAMPAPTTTIAIHQITLPFESCGADIVCGIKIGVVAGSVGFTVGCGWAGRAPSLDCWLAVCGGATATGAAGGNLSATSSLDPCCAGGATVGGVAGAG